MDASHPRTFEKVPRSRQYRTPNPRRRKKTGAELLADGLGRIADAVAPQQSWKEKAMELFWKDFGSEDMGFQMEAVDALKDEAVAISFCKMSPESRKL